jgi:hypothetical protein
VTVEEGRRHLPDLPAPHPREESEEDRMSEFLNHGQLFRVHEPGPGPHEESAADVLRRVYALAPLPERWAGPLPDRKSVV